MTAQPPLSSRHRTILEIGGLRFRDLDGDGELSPFEDWRLSPAERAEDVAAAQEAHRGSVVLTTNSFATLLLATAGLSGMRVHPEKVRRIRESVGSLVVGPNATIRWLLDEIEPLTDAPLIGFDPGWDAIVDANFGSSSPSGRLRSPLRSPRRRSRTTTAPTRPHPRASTLDVARPPRRGCNILRPCPDDPTTSDSAD